MSGIEQIVQDILDELEGTAHDDDNRSRVENLLSGILDELEGTAYDDDNYSRVENQLLGILAAIRGGGGKTPYLLLEHVDDYLYSVLFNTIPPDSGIESSVSGGCSSFVQNGKLHRNLDWYYSETASFKVTTPDFVGMSMLAQLTEGGEFDDDIVGQLPYHVNDGVNKNGIMVSTHVLYNDWDWEGTGDIPLSKVPYLVLTNVESMATIADDLDGVLDNLYAYPSLAAADYLLQFIVTDGSTTYVIMPPTDSSGSYILTDISSNPKLTNFRWVSSSSVVRTDLQDRPNGVERWNLMPCDLDDLRYTKAYESFVWPSEFIGINDTDKDSTDAELEDIYDIAHSMYEERERDGKLWQTMHSVVYSPNGIDHLYVQEDWTDDHGSGIFPSGTKTITDTSLTDVTEYASAQVVDANLVAGNIKKDVTVLGITGTHEGGITPTGTKTITDTSLTDVTDYANAQVVDADLIPSNIKKDVNILGVTGTFEGGGSTPTKGFVPTAWNADGYVTSGIWYGSTMPSYAFAIYNTTYKHTCSYKLSEITVSDAVTIPDHAFTYCPNLTLTSLPAGVTSIGSYAFRGCTKLTLTSLPAGVTSIDTYAFSSCTSLTLISFPAGVTTISNSAFQGCTGITRIEFNSTPSLVSGSAFQGCTNLLDIYVPWADGAVANAPWGATNASIHYDWTGGNA